LFQFFGLHGAQLRCFHRAQQLGLITWWSPRRKAATPCHVSAAPFVPRFNAM